MQQVPDLPGEHEATYDETIADCRQLSSQEIRTLEHTGQEDLDVHIVSRAARHDAVHVT